MGVLLVAAAGLVVREEGHEEGAETTGVYQMRAAVLTWQSGRVVSGVPPESGEVDVRLDSALAAPAEAPAESSAGVGAADVPDMRGGAGYADGLEALICAYDWPCGEAVAIAGCESGYDADGRLDGVYADSGDSRGLYQIHEVHLGRFAERGWDYWADVFDPAKNIEIAHEIWEGQGWRPWACEFVLW